MTQQELFARLASGNYTVKSKVGIFKNLTGRIQSINILGKYIRVFVLYEGQKFEIAYDDCPEVTHRHVRYLSEIE